MSEAFRGRRRLLATPTVTTFGEVFGGLRSPASVLAMQALELPRLRGVPVRPIARLERVEAQLSERPASGADSARRSDKLREPAPESLSRAHWRRRRRGEARSRPVERRWLRRPWTPQGDVRQSGSRRAERKCPARRASGSRAGPGATVPDPQRHGYSDATIPWRPLECLRATHCRAP